MRAVAVVDPHEAGALYAARFAARDCRVIRVQTHPDLPDHRRGDLREQDFDAVVRLDGGEAAAVDVLRAAGVTVVVTGHEHGVETADRLRAALGLPGNGLAQSRARRHKGEMKRAAAAAGLAVAESLCSASEEELVAWARSRWPVVVKPTRGYGACGVQRCEEEAGLRAALRQVFGEPDAFGARNDEALVQRWLEGPEHVVDTVSWDGVHRLSALWRYERRAPRPGPIPLFEAKTLLRATDAGALFPYAGAVLDALGVRFGPAHAEIVETRGGPVLVEVGARLHGGAAAHALCEALFEDSQLAQSVRAHLAGSPAEGLAYAGWTGHARMLVLTLPRPGLTLRSGAGDAVAAVPGVMKSVWNARPGAPLPSIAGLVMCGAADARGLEDACCAVRALEAEALYEVG